MGTASHVQPAPRKGWVGSTRGSSPAYLGAGSDVRMVGLESPESHPGGRPSGPPGLAEPPSHPPAPPPPSAEQTPCPLHSVHAR